jgi:hypothetical protein
LIAFLLSLLTFAGRATRTNLARYGAPSPRTQARWVDGRIDFPTLTLAALEQEGILRHPLLLVLDASFLSKSGKKTYGKGRFWNGCHSQVEGGLEISTLGLIDVYEGRAYALDTRQTPAESTEDASRMDVYLAHVVAMKPRLPAQVKYLVVDGGYTRKGFVDGVCQQGLHLIGTLRKDADLLYLFEGIRERRRGAPKKYDGKVKVSELARFEEVSPLASGEEVRTKVVWSKSLNRAIRVVGVRTKPGAYALFFSTDLTLAVADLRAWYRLRFQLEFVFRDGKQFTGLGECQARSQDGQAFHHNAALLATTLLRLEERQASANVYSLATVKKHRYNEALARLILKELNQDADSPANQHILEKAREYGCVAA